MNYAGLIYDDSRHYIDHLGPFCALLKWPLIVCEPSIAQLCRSYYPDLEVIETSLWDLVLPAHTVTCDTAPLLEAAFPGQKTNILWLPHGNSDKGWKSPFFEALGKEKIAFVYGQRMVDFMHAKNVVPCTLRIGNFRWSYFLKHLDFYEKKIAIRYKSAILYAPTWEDAENGSSFWESFPSLAKNFPQNHHLLVKLHPNTLRKYEGKLEALINRHTTETVAFLPDIPPIYPILTCCDAYIGDTSSIGYDFLTFDRPLYFLNANPDLPLHRCGSAIKSENFCALTADGFSHLRKAAYRYTFDPLPDWDQLKEQIDALCRV